MTGYVAHKLRLKHPDLGRRTDVLEKDEKCSLWIAANFKGGLRQPTDTFLEATKAMEQVFEEVHGPKGFCQANDYGGENFGNPTGVPPCS